MIEELTTPRMRLVPSTAQLVRAEIGDREAFARLLAARVPDEWPPDEAADALPWFLERLEEAGDNGVGWHGFYGIVVEDEADAPVLVGGGGTIAPPADGVVEIGYSLLPAFQGRGYATEMMSAILEWIATDPRVSRVTAETANTNDASRRVLARLGFREVGPGREPGSVAFERAAVP